MQYQYLDGVKRMNGLEGWKRTQCCFLRVLFCSFSHALNLPSHLTAYCLHAHFSFSIKYHGLFAYLFFYVFLPQSEDNFHLCLSYSKSVFLFLELALPRMPFHTLLPVSASGRSNWTVSSLTPLGRLGALKGMTFIKVFISLEWDDFFLFFSPFPAPDYESSIYSFMQIFLKV